MRTVISWAAIIFSLIFFTYAVDSSQVTDSLDPSTREIMDGLSPEDINVSSGFEKFRDAALSEMKKELKKAASGSIVIYGVAVISAVMGGFIKTSGSDISVKAAETAAVCAISAVCFSQSNTVLSSCLSSIKNLGIFSKALLPVYAASMSVSGKPVSSVAIQTAAMGFSGIIIFVTEKIVIPLIYVYMVAMSAGLVGESDFLVNGAELLKKAASWFYKVTLTAFTFFISVTKAVSSGADAAAVKTAQTAISASVPILGSVLSDTSDALLSGAAVIRGSLGAFGLLASLFICLVPFISSFIKMTVFRILELFSGSFAGGKTSKMLASVSSAFGMALGALGSCCTVMFIAIVIGAASI